VENRFQSLPFKCNLQRYIMVRAFVVRGKNLRPLDPSGLCDPYLKAGRCVHVECT
jgi:hypothetical protein